MSAVDPLDQVVRDERDWLHMVECNTGLDPLTVGSLREACQRQLEHDGVTGMRVVTQRRNAAGDPIGPEVLISYRFAWMVQVVATHVAEARNAAIEAELEVWPS